MSDPFRCGTPPGRTALMLLMCLAASTARAQVGSTTAPLIQGTDSLVEPFDALAPPALAAVVIETQAALMLTTALTLTETTAALNPSPTLSELWQLCPGEPFEEQTTAAFCSGTLIAADLVLTADHCVPDNRSCAALSVVFDYRYTSAGVLAPLERDDVYGCRDIATSDATADYVVIQLDRAVVGRAPANPRLSDPRTCLGVQDGDRLWAAGFPSGVPLKLDLGDPVSEGVPVVDSNVSSRRFFRAGFDSFAGMDGGGVFNTGLELVGALSTGRADYARTTAGCFAAVRVTDSPRELASHVIQPLAALCNRSSDYPALCPATVNRCSTSDNGSLADAGVRAFPPSDGCGCRVVDRRDAPARPSGGSLLALVSLALIVRRARRRYSRTSPRAKILAT